MAYFVDENELPLGTPPSLSIERPERWRAIGQAPNRAHRIVMAQAHYPGWTARLNGTKVPLKKWDGFLQSVDIPKASAGRSLELALDFRPTGWPLWALFSTASWAAWFGLWLRRARAAS